MRFTLVFSHSVTKISLPIGTRLFVLYVSARTHLCTNVRSRQDEDFNYVRTQVRIVKDGFDLCPDISQNMDYLCPIMDPAKNKIWNIYVRAQVKIAKDGFELCPETSQNNKRWI